MACVWRGDREGTLAELRVASGGVACPACDRDTLRGMRAIVTFAILAVAAPAQADSFVDILGGMSLPVSDDDWTNLVESSPKIGVRIGSVPDQIGGFLQADWTPVNTEAQGWSVPGASGDISAHRFRIHAGAMLHHHISNTLVVTGRGGLGVDIAHANVSVSILGNTTETSETDAGLGLEFGGGVFFRAGNLEIGGEVGLPIGFHDHDGDIDFQYTSFDIDLLFCARFLSR